VTPRDIIYDRADQLVFAEFPPVQTSALRMILTASEPSRYWSIHELYVNRLK
jgi:hypothetical protein